MIFKDGRVTYDVVAMEDLKGRQLTTVERLLSQVRTLGELGPYDVTRSNVDRNCVYLAARVDNDLPSMSFLCDQYLFVIGPRGGARQLLGRERLARRKRLGGKN